MSSKTYIVKRRPGQNQPAEPRSSEDRTRRTNLPLNIPKKVIVMLVHFTHFTKTILRQIWTLLVTGRRTSNLQELTDAEACGYNAWLWLQLSRRQVFRTNDYFADYVFCYYIYDEMVTLGNQRIRVHQEYKKKPTFEILDLIEDEDKVASINKWVDFASRWVSVEKFIEARRTLEDQRRIEEELLLEEYTRFQADHKLIEEQRQAEMESTLTYESLDDISTLEEEESSITEYKMSETSRVMHVTETKPYTLHTFWRRDVSKKSCAINKVVEREIGNQFLEGGSQSSFDQERCNSGEMKNNKGGITFWVGDESKQSCAINKVEEREIGNQFLEGGSQSSFDQEPCNSGEMKTNKGGITFWVGDC